jgi:hypothetical protein
MTDIEVVGIKSTKLIDLYQDATLFYVSQLFKRDPNLNIIVEFTRGMEADAFCICLSTGRSPKLFAIEVNVSLKKTEVLKALAHEIVHCKQYRTNQIKYKSDDIYWEGKRYKWKNDEDMFLNSPWEIEAYEKEEYMYNNFILWYDKLI